MVDLAEALLEGEQIVHNLSAHKKRSEEWVRRRASLAGLPQSLKESIRAGEMNRVGILVLSALGEIPEPSTSASARFVNGAEDVCCSRHGLILFALEQVLKKPSTLERLTCLRRVKHSMTRHIGFKTFEKHVQRLCEEIEERQKRKQREALEGVRKSILTALRAHVKALRQLQEKGRAHCAVREDELRGLECRLYKVITKHLELKASKLAEPGERLRQPEIKTEARKKPTPTKARPKSAAKPKKLSPREVAERLKARKTKQSPKRLPATWGITSEPMAPLDRELRNLELRRSKEAERDAARRKSSTVQPLPRAPKQAHSATATPTYKGFPRLMDVWDPRVLRFAGKLVQTPYEALEILARPEGDGFREPPSPETVEEWKKMARRA